MPLHPNDLAAGTLVFQLEIEWAGQTLRLSDIEHDAPFGVDDATAAAIGKGARELSARRRGSKGAAAAEAGAWNSKFLARYGLDKTLR